MTKECDWELVEGDEGIHEGLVYVHYICHTCFASEWHKEDSFPESCLNKERIGFILNGKN